MTNKDRSINTFLSIVFIIVGLYMSVGSVQTLFSSETDTLFRFSGQDIPAFYYLVKLGGGVISLMTGLVMWLRVSWSPGLALFTSGLLISHQLGNMGRLIYTNPVEAVAAAIILIILLQSFPYLIRRTYR